MSQAIGFNKWVSRCADTITRLLPAMSADTATERATQLLTDAYGYAPEIAAAVFVHGVDLQGSIGGECVAGAGEWRVTFELDDANEEEIARAVAAAAAVFKSCSVSAYFGGVAWVKFDSFDDCGFDPLLKLTPKEDAALQAWFDAERAANLALNAGNPAGRRSGEMGVVPPAMIPFAKAHLRWVKEWSETTVQLAPSHPRGMWLDRFASQIGKLRPAMTPASAWRYAETTFDFAADMEPEEAAEFFAPAEPPDTLGAPE